MLEIALVILAVACALLALSLARKIGFTIVPCG